MPGLPTTGYGTADGVLNLSRTLILDVLPTIAGSILTDTGPYAFQYLNAAYHDMQFELDNAGIETFYKETILTNVTAVVATDSSVQVNISDSGYFDGTNNHATPQLPTDLLVPKRMWERQTGASEDFLPMTQRPDGMPSRTQKARMEEWEWRQDGIYMVGSTQSNDLRLRYDAVVPDLVAGTDSVLIRGAQNALGFAVAALFVGTRNGDAKQFLSDGYAAALAQLKRRSSRRQQHFMHRRKPFGSRKTIFDNIQGQQP